MHKNHCILWEKVDYVSILREQLLYKWVKKVGYKQIYSQQLAVLLNLLLGLNM